MSATEYTAAEGGSTEDTEYTEVPFGVRLFARLLPQADREAVIGDLLEEADGSRLGGARRTLWLAGECGAVAVRLSVQSARASFVLPPVRELVCGLAIDGRGVLREGAATMVLRALIFVASVATLAVAVEVLVRTLMTAAGL